jgi:hypothetical protein
MTLLDPEDVTTRLDWLIIAIVQQGCRPLALHVSTEEYECLSLWLFNRVLPGLIYDGVPVVVR